MARVTRRAFLQTSVGAATGVAAAGAVGLAGNGLVASIVGEAHAPDAKDQVVAYVRSGSKGEVTLLVGEREVTTRDPVLVNRMLRAAR